MLAKAVVIAMAFTTLADHKLDDHAGFWRDDFSLHVLARSEVSVQRSSFPC